MSGSCFGVIRSQDDLSLPQLIVCFKNTQGPKRKGSHFTSARIRKNQSITRGPSGVLVVQQPVFTLLQQPTPIAPAPANPTRLGLGVQEILDSLSLPLVLCFLLVPVLCILLPRGFYLPSVGFSASAPPNILIRPKSLFPVTKCLGG